jgi:hypothetical protein
MVAIQRHCATGANASSEKRGWKKSTLNFVTGQLRLAEAKKLHLRLASTATAIVIVNIITTIMVILPKQPAATPSMYRVCVLEDTE